MNVGSNHEPGNHIKLRITNNDIDLIKHHEEGPINWRNLVLIRINYLVTPHRNRNQKTWAWGRVLLENPGGCGWANGKMALPSSPVVHAWLFQLTQRSGRTYAVPVNNKPVRPSQHKSNANIKAPPCLWFEWRISFLWSRLPLIFIPWIGSMSEWDRQDSLPHRCRWCKSRPLCPSWPQVIHKRFRLRHVCLLESGYEETWARISPKRVKNMLKNMLKPCSTHMKPPGARFKIQVWSSICTKALSKPLYKVMFVALVSDLNVHQSQLSHHKSAQNTWTSSMFAG